MQGNQDFVERLQSLDDHEVEFLLVGAHALAAHGHVRAAKGLDIFLRPSPENAERATHAFAAFGAPLRDLTADDLATEGTIVPIGMAPVRIDILTRIDGVTFDEAFRDRVQARFGARPVAVLSRAHLTHNKRASGRRQDSADVERLEMPDD